MRVDEIRRYNEMGDRILKAMILDYLEKYGEGYSVDIKGTFRLDIPVAKIQKAMAELEESGELESEIREPPFPDRTGGMMRRRYYRIVDK